jgi:hypothetical protein
VATPNPFEKYLPELGLAPESDNQFSDPEYPIEEPVQPEQPEQPPAPAANPFAKYLPELGLAGPEPMAPPEEPSFLGNVGEMLSQSGTQFKANLSSYLLTRQWDDLDDETRRGLTEAMAVANQYHDKPEELDRYLEKIGGEMEDVGAEWDAGNYVGAGIEAIDFLGETIWEGITNPKGFAYMTAEQGANLAATVGAGWATGKAGAVTGGAVASVIPGAGTAGGVLVGGTGGFLLGATTAGYLIETGAQVREFISEQGGDPTDPQSIYDALNNAELRKEMLDNASKKGLSIAAFDAAANLLGIKLLKGVKGPMSALKRGTGALSAQVGGAFGGEVTGQQLATGDVNWRDVGAEVALEIGPGGLAEPVAGAWQARKYADNPIEDTVLPADANKDAITRALNQRAVEMEKEGVIRDEREMLDSEKERAEMVIARAAEEQDAQEQVYKSAAHAEVKLQQLEKKYGETKLFPSQIETGEWILEPYGMHSARQVAAERQERLGGIDLRPAEEIRKSKQFAEEMGYKGIEVTEGEQIDITEPAPTTEGIEVGEEIIATEPAPTTEGIEVTEEPPYGGGLIPEPTARRIAVTEEQAEEVVATEPAPTTEGLEVEEVTPEEVGEAIPQIGVTEVTEGEETIELKGNKIYQRKTKKPPPDDEGPGGGGGAPVEGGGPITPSILSGAIATGREARPEVEGELAQVDAQLAEMPTSVDAMSEEAPEQTGKIHDLRIQRRDLMDERDYRVKPEEAKQARKEFWKKLREAGLSVNRYESIAEMRKRLADRKIKKGAESIYQNVVDVIAAAAEEGDAPTVEYIQKKTGLSAKAAKRNLDRYNKEVAGEPDTKPLVSPETPVEQTQEPQKPVNEMTKEELETELGYGGTMQPVEWLRERLERKRAEAVAPVEHPKVPGRMDTDTLPDGSTYDLSKSAETQIATTVGTYDKVKARYFEDVDNGDILDYGAGKGLASQKHGFESLEPYPRGWTPTYQDTYKIKRQYDGIILNNILNVLPKHTRRAVMWDAAEKLRPGGQMYINVRSRGDVMKTTVIAKQFNDSEILTGRGTYQKGFQQQELINFIQDELGPDYTVETAFYGSVSVMVTKKGAATDVAPLTAEAAQAEAAKTVEGREAVDEEAQIAAFNFVDSNPAFTGLKLSHKPGDERYGKTLAHYYGDLDNTQGADGDPLDVMLGKDFEIGKEYPAFVVNLVDPKTGDFEQHKIVSGVEDILEAEEVAESMYPDQVDDISQITPEEFTRFAKSKRTQEPFDRDTFRGEMKKGQDLRKPTETDTVLDPTELGSTQADAIDHSPWLLADGSIVATGGDHMGYAMERGMDAETAQDVRAISQMQLEAGAVRSAFFYDNSNDLKTGEPSNTSVAWLHLHDDQTLTDEQIAAVEAYGKAARKAGRKVRILIGSTPTHKKGDDPVNPVVKKSSIAGLKREFGARRARYRADLKKFYAGLSEKTARYSQAAVGRMRAELKPNPARDELVTFIRKLGGINFLAERQLRSLEADYRALNKNYRLPGLPGMVQTDGTGLTISQLAEVATHEKYLETPPEGEGAYNDNAMLDALTDALQGGVLYSKQNEQWMKDVWEEEQQRELERMEDEAKADAEYLAEQGIPTDLGELMALAAQFDKYETEDIVSREDNEDVVKQQLTDLINERKAQIQAGSPEAEEGAPADAGVEAETQPRQRIPVPSESPRKPEGELDPGNFEGLEDYPWQDFAELAGVEILTPPTPDIEGPRGWVIDVYSDIKRTKFVKRVYAANFFRHRDVETAFLARKGPYKARIQERDEFIQINKVTVGMPDTVTPGKGAAQFSRWKSKARGKISWGEHGILINTILGPDTNKPYRDLKSIQRIERERGAERKKEVSDRETGWLTPEQWQATIEGYRDGLMAEPNPEDIVKHWGEEFKRKGTERNYISHEEGRKKIAEWEKHAKNTKVNNGQRVILSLFDATGEWAQPWLDAGYDVRAIDMKRDDLDIMDIDYGWLRDVGFLDGEGIWGILAACPCQKFTNTNRRDFRPGTERPVNEGGADMIGFTHSSVDLVEHTLAIIEFLQPRFWALENPLGRIQDITGAPTGRLSFNPNNYGDPYTKKTVLHGNFNANLPLANVDPREEFGGQGTKMHKLGSRDELDGGLRSVTPKGFAYSFFMANNDADYPIHQEIAKGYVATITDDMRAKEPNLDRMVEIVVTLAMYDGASPTLEEGGTDSYYLNELLNDSGGRFPNWAQELVNEVQLANEEDWRTETGRVITVRELKEMDTELRGLMELPQKSTTTNAQ